MCLLKWFKKITAIIVSVAVTIGIISGLKHKEVEPMFDTLTPYVKAEKETDIFEMGRYDIIVSNDGAVKSLEQSKEILKRTLPEGEKATVWFREGVYVFDKEVVFDSSDAQNVTYNAYPGEEVKFVGCKEINGWIETTVNGVKAWVADTDEEKINSMFSNFDQKLENTKYPENGYLMVSDTDRENSVWKTEEEAFWPYTRGDYSLFCDELKGKAFKNPEDIEIRILHYWKDEHALVTNLDSSNGRVFFNIPCSMTINKNDRFFLQNVFEALNNPGEWYHDTKQNKVYYIPFENETIENTKLYSSSTSKLLTVEDCSSITFKNINFMDTAWSFQTVDPNHWFGMHGLIHSQAAYDTAGAIEILRSDNIVFKYCNFKNIGNCGIKFREVNKDCTVTGCVFENIGSSGVFIDGQNAVGNDSMITERIRITDNIITKYGRKFFNAIGVMLSHGRDCEITHNEIHDGYYSGVSVGWNWGYAEHVSCRNNISYNHIYDIGQGWLSDMGGIYTLGVQEGTVLRGNVIHNVAADPNEGGYGGWGIYLDEGSSYMTVENNLSYDCGSNSFHQHYGKENLVRNNIFGFSGNGEIIVSRQEEHTSIILERNIIVADKNFMYDKMRKGTIKDDKNLYWDYSRHENVMSENTDGYNVTKSFVKSVYNFYNNGVFKDPLFRDAENFDFTLATNSPAIEEIGFIPFDYRVAGTLTNLG